MIHLIIPIVFAIAAIASGQYSIGDSVDAIVSAVTSFTDSSLFDTLQAQADSFLVAIFNKLPYSAGLPDLSFTAASYFGSQLSWLNIYFPIDHLLFILSFYFILLSTWYTYRIILKGIALARGVRLW